MAGRTEAPALPRSVAEYVEEVARRHRGEVTRIIERSTRGGSPAAGPAAISFPVVPVEFVGPYEHDFSSTALLSGLYLTSSSGAAMSADGELLVSATGSASPAWAYPGREGGAFLPHNGEWTVDIHVTECAGNGERAGIGITPGDMCNGITWGSGAGKAYCYFYDNAGTPKVFGGASTYDSATISQFPSRSSPVCLRIEQTFPGDVRTLKFYYREGASSQWTLFKTDIPGSGYWTEDLDLGPITGLIGSTGDYSAAYEKMSVDYTPELTPGIYAFIPTESFGGRSKDHVYVSDPSGSYVDITPQEWTAVIAVGRIYVYDGSSWVPLEFSHSDLIGTGENDHHDRKHGIDSGTDHAGVSGAVQDDFVSFDSAGLPKDSGKSASSFAAASHEHDERYYTESETDSLLGSKADKTGSSDIEITDSGKGVILKSPDGHRWRVTVDNSGQLNTSDLGT